MEHGSYHAILLVCIPLAITFCVMGVFKPVFLLPVIPLIVTSIGLMYKWIKKMEIESHENL